MEEWSSMATTFAARRLLTDTGQIDYPVVTFDGGKLVGVEAGAPNGSEETLTSAFFDVHVHGACSYDFMAATPAEIDSVGKFLASRGVGHYLPTTVTGPLDATLHALERLADAIERSATTPGNGLMAAPVGIHLEGPFVSHLKRGVHPEASILEPSEMMFDRFQEAARGHIRLMTIAPELPHAIEVIRRATSEGVRVSMGHSNATAAETLAGVAAGATSATHLFNAMRTMDHREPGIVGTVLDHGDVYAEMICDGVHVDPAIVRLWLKMKGAERGILVTDGMSATGMPDGTYMLGDFPVEVKNGVCLTQGTLAGSVLTMDAAVENVRRFTGTSLETAVGLASHNPARMLGMERVTAMVEGSAAQFNVYDENGQRVAGIFHGQRYEV
jgi:N-acetylglucosamine-6-phosphate deacetylase